MLHSLVCATGYTVTACCLRRFLCNTCTFLNLFIFVSQMDIISFYFFSSTLVLFLEQKAYSTSPGASLLGSESDPETKPTHKALHREKRCSCVNLKDKECVYFCHIGIVWVNTPGQVVPYGVGYYPVRLRRETARCLCVSNSDVQCRRFCTKKYLLQEHTAHVLLNKSLFAKKMEIVERKHRPDSPSVKTGKLEISIQNT
uniref:Endothelin 4 n=1 Tax=Lepisosteus oculatus TaxID=7918 RepID=W5LWS2_LEPOC